MYSPIGPTSRPIANGTRQPHARSASEVSAVVSTMPNAEVSTIARPCPAHCQLAKKPLRVAVCSNR